MRMTYDSDADAAYLAIGDEVADGSAVENVVIERPGRGDIVLDFDADGRLLGVEVIGAHGTSPPGCCHRSHSNLGVRCSSTAWARNGSWRARAVKVTAFGQMWRAGAA